MSDKLTRIGIPGNSRGNGFMDWGEKTPAEMIAVMRARADHLREQAALIDATADDGFEIEVIRGSHVQHHVKWLQRPTAPDTLSQSTGRAEP